MAKKKQKEEAEKREAEEKAERMKRAKPASATNQSRLKAKLQGEKDKKAEITLAQMKQFTMPAKGGLKSDIDEKEFEDKILAQLMATNPK